MPASFLYAFAPRETAPEVDQNNAVAAMIKAHACAVRWPYENVQKPPCIPRTVLQ